MNNANITTDDLAAAVRYLENEFRSCVIEEAPGSWRFDATLDQIAEGLALGWAADADHHHAIARTIHLNADQVAYLVRQVARVKAGVA